MKKKTYQNTNQLETRWQVAGPDGPYFEPGIIDPSTRVNISSNTLFHFTNNAENLLNILKNEFSPRYCAEYGLSEPVLDSVTVPLYAKPMICFCDLPLFLIKRHLTFYGCYGIGMSKEWGESNGVTPVLYLHG